MKWLFLFIALVHQLCVQVQAQPYRFRSYDTRDGLSSNDVRDVLKDEAGFLWIATGNGLNRFDGNAFDQFFNDPADPNSLPGNEINTLYSDRRKQLWVGTSDGISRFDPVKQEFYNYYPDSSNGKCGRWFLTMQEDHTGKLWVGTWYELLIFDPAAGKFRRSGWADFAATHKPARGNNNRIVILSLLPKNTTELWVLTTYGLYSVHTTTGKFTWYPYSGVDDYYGCQLTYTDEQGNPWIGAYNNGMLLYHQQTGKWSSFLPPVSRPKEAGSYRALALCDFGKDTLLYAGSDGPGFFDKNKLNFLPGKKWNAGSMPPLGYYKAIRAGDHYWFSTSNGIVQLYPVRSPFQQLAPFGDNAYINRAYAVNGFPGQYILYDPQQLQITRWERPTNQKMPVYTTDKKGIQSEITGWYQQGHTGYISTDENIYRYHLLGNTATAITLPPSVFPENERTVRNMVIDKDGTGWIRLRTQGVVKYDTLTGKTAFIRFIPPELEHSYSAIQYSGVQHCLWVAVEHNGLYQYDIRTGKAIHFPLYRKTGTVNQGNITALISLPNGDLYAADASEGVYYYQHSSRTFTRYTMRDGLPGNNCNALAMDQQGMLWIATSQGLSRFDPRQKIFTNYSPDDVLPAYLGFISTGDGETMLTCNGSYFYEWHAGSMHTEDYGDSLYIRNILVNNKPVALDTVFRLSYQENNITLQAGIITSGPADLEYSITNGTDWVKMDRSHTVSFSRLPPGRYQLLVRQKGNPRMLRLQILIQTPWWKHPLFRASLVLLILCTGILLALRRILSIRKSAMLKQKMAETEMMALRAQMNPHFIFNCISSIDNFIQDNDRENASAWLSKFARLIRSILDSSKNEVVPFWKDWETLQLYLELEKLRSDHSFTVELSVQPDLLNGHYRVPPLVIQPFVENAIHHGLLHRGDKNGILKIGAVLQENKLVYTIEDNGIGRAKAAALNAVNRLSHSSYGLQMSRERIELFNQHKDNAVHLTDLYDTQGQAAGTKVEIILYV